MELSAKTLRQLRSLLRIYESGKSESELVEKAVDALYRRERNKALKKCAIAQRKYHEEHPEEAEFMMKLQGF